MLFTGWEVRVVKNCDRGLEYAALDLRPRTAFSSPRSQFLPIRTDSRPANIFFLPAVNWLASWFVYATLSLNWQNICRKSITQTSE